MRRRGTTGQGAARRAVVGGLILLVALLTGAGAYAFGGAGGSREDGPAGTAASGASEPPEPSRSAASTSGSGPSTAPASASPSAPTGPTTPTSSSASRGASGRPSTGGCPQGEKQRDVEAALVSIGGYGAVTVDGVQSPADCAAIVRFQQRFGISPANGRAGPTTGDVARRISASRTAEVQARCRAGAGLTACVDLALQTVWVVRDGALVWGPTVVRTGFRGYATPAGSYRVNRRNLREWSVPYEVWLPYWQQFNGGIGFHQTTTYLHNSSLGSHGCVNLLGGDARSLWNLIGVGTTVRTFGRRAGT